MTMGTRAFSCIPTQLTSNEGKRNLCSQVFARSCMRPLMLVFYKGQRCKVLFYHWMQDFKTWTYFPAAVFATNDSMGNHLLCILPESIPSSQNNCTIETPQAETAQLKQDGITTMHYIPQNMKTVVWCILLQVPTPHRRGQNLSVSIILSHCFSSSTPNNPFLHLDSYVCLREKDYGSHVGCDIRVNTLQWTILLAGFRRQRGSQESQIRPQKAHSHRKSVTGAAPRPTEPVLQNLSTPHLCFVWDAINWQICYRSNIFGLLTRLQHLTQVTGSWEELLCISQTEDADFTWKLFNDRQFLGNISWNKAS